MKPVIIYPTTVDWDYLHQRPQQLLKALAQKDCLTIFCNVNKDYLHPPGFEQISRNLILANNMDIPQAIAWAQTSMSGEPIVLYYSNPPQYNRLKSLAVDYIVFDALDEPENEFSSWKENYKLCVQNANLVLASSTSLFERVAQLSPQKALLVPNACDYTHFSQAQKQIPLPDMKFNKKIIGYIGAVALWLDWALIHKAVQTYTNYAFIFVGPFYGCADAPVKAKNLYYLGHKDYGKLPAYLSNFDVCWMPFAINQVTKGVNPIKMWEYLASGKPVVSTSLPEANTKYIDIISQDNLLALAQDSPPQAAEKRIKFAQENSWALRAETVVSALMEGLKCYPQ
ncbi:MAG: glycosyltransferase [Pelosinus sp.]|nr:glycosyltransferase [Pelosinus sp.]